MSNTQASRTLILYGTALIFVSLLTGAAIEIFQSRMLLSAHLAGTLGGILCIAVAGAMRKLELTESGRKWLVTTLLSSGYMNWSVTVLGALLGTKNMTPLFGKGGAPEVAETIVSALLVLMTIPTFAALAILARGARSKQPPGE